MDLHFHNLLIHVLAVDVRNIMYEKALTLKVRLTKVLGWKPPKTLLSNGHPAKTTKNPEPDDG